MDTPINNNNGLPVWLVAAVVAAGMTAYADDLGRPALRAKPVPAPLSADKDDHARNDPLPPAS